MKLSKLTYGNKCCSEELNLLSFLKRIEYEKKSLDLSDIYVYYGYCPARVRSESELVMFSDQYNNDKYKGIEWEKWWGMKKGSEI